MISDRSGNLSSSLTGLIFGLVRRNHCLTFPEITPVEADPRLLTNKQGVNEGWEFVSESTDSDASAG